MKLIEETKDWVDHLRVRPYLDDLYPHPGMWLTRGDYSEHRLVLWMQDFDSAVLAPVMCRLGFHRWISTHKQDEPWRTRCWYCEKPKL